MLISNISCIIYVTLKLIKNQQKRDYKTHAARKKPV